eukprot:TRINITY_DN9320_c0_g1_i1.p1 TRINITY_DN9320_c0_g1~~TRINITY_DN9320_c0_g1_i1.p1  ORF type:complete len:124 (+),score=34.30 TRINITY_DN9320_c0_g1_i1:64-435(+)
MCIRDRQQGSRLVIKDLSEEEEVLEDLQVTNESIASILRKRKQRFEKEQGDQDEETQLTEGLDATVKEKPYKKYLTNQKASKDILNFSKPKLDKIQELKARACLLYTSPSPRDRQKSRMPSSA